MSQNAQSSGRPIACANGFTTSGLDSSGSHPVFRSSSSESEASPAAAGAATASAAGAGAAASVEVSDMAW